MSLFEFENSELSCIKNNNENETITDKIKNIIYKLNKIIIKPDNIIKEFKIDKPDYIIFGLQKIVDEIERIIFNAESTREKSEIVDEIESIIPVYEEPEKPIIIA